MFNQFEPRAHGLECPEGSELPCSALGEADTTKAHSSQKSNHMDLSPAALPIPSIFHWIFLTLHFLVIAEWVRSGEKQRADGLLFWTILHR